MFPLFLLSIGLSTLISYFLTPIVEKFFISHAWIEDPVKKQQQTHNATALTAVPRGGGLPVYLAVLFTSLFLLPLDKHLIGILLAAFLTLIVGLFDDVKNISPHFRLLTNLLAALIVVASGIGVAYLSNPFGGIINLSHPQIHFNFFGPHSLWLLSDLIAVFWIIWCMNTVGWAAGIEGQLPGFVSIAAIFIGILGLKYSTDATQWPVIILAGAVTGAYLGFLPFNFFPQSIMPGYSGKSLAGFFLAVLSILSGAKLATLMFLLGIPILDAVAVIIRRLLQHRPLLLSDGQHFHHFLLKIGWSRSHIALLYWFLTLLFGLISLFLNSQQKFYVFIGLALIFFTLLIRISQRT